MTHGGAVRPVPPPTALAAVIARRLRMLRESQGMSAAEVARAMAETGISWERSQVVNLETGRRQNVTVDEWLALAYVLGVTPAALLVDLSAGASDVLPQVQALPYELLAWLQGRGALPGQSDERARFPHPQIDAARAVGPTWEAIKEWDRSVSLGELDELSSADQQEQLKLADHRRARLARLASQLVGAGVRLPVEIEAYLTVHGRETPDGPR